MPRPLRTAALLLGLVLLAGCRTDPQELDARLQAALAVGDGKSALAAVDALLDADPDSAERLAQRGQALELLGRTDEALEAYRLAIRQAPERSDIVLQRGLCLLRLERFALAAKDLRVVSDLEPANGYARGYLAAALADTNRTGDLAAAERIATSLLDRDPRNLGALVGLSLVRARQGLVSEAKDLAARARREAPEDPLVARLVARVGLR